MMEKFAFKMQLNPGCREEYERRHNEIWPELVELLQDAGISDYSIHIDEETNVLFGVMLRTENHKMDALPAHEIMRKWWAYMADVMLVHPDNEPVATPLQTVFHMP